MHLTQEYIDRKEGEYKARGLKRSLAEALIMELQCRFERELIEAELSNAGPEKLTTDTSATT